MSPSSTPSLFIVGAHAAMIADNMVPASTLKVVDAADQIDSEGPTYPTIWRNRAFLIIFTAAFVSGSGRWTQQVVLGILALGMSSSPVLTTQVIFAQFIPMSLLGPVGGAVADTVDRRNLLVLALLWQAGWTAVLAWNLVDGEISSRLLLSLVFLGGLSMPFYAPALQALVPSVVGREHLAAAISANSAQLNGSRVLGPVVGAWLAAATDFWFVMAVVAVSYVVSIAGLFAVQLPPVVPSVGPTHWVRFVTGFRIAARAEQIRGPMLIMATFALFCLPFVGLLPVIAERNLGMESKSPAYGLLYAVFGVGAMVGAGSVGTVFRSLSSQAVVRWSLIGFGASLAALAFLETSAPAYPVMFLVGLFYFTMPTALTTFIQLHLTDNIRGRIMALWILAFGGVVPITNLLSGPLVELTSLRWVLLGGTVAAFVLAVVVRLRPGPQYGEELAA